MIPLRRPLACSGAQGAGLATDSAPMDSRSVAFLGLRRIECRWRGSPPPRLGSTVDDRWGCFGGDGHTAELSCSETALEPVGLFSATPYRGRGPHLASARRFVGMPRSPRCRGAEIDPVTAVPALAIGRAIAQAIYAGEVGTGNSIVGITKYIRKFELVEPGPSTGRPDPPPPPPGLRRPSSPPRDGSGERVVIPRERHSRRRRRKQVAQGATLRRRLVSKRRTRIQTGARTAVREGSQPSPHPQSPIHSGSANTYSAFSTSSG